MKKLIIAAALLLGTAVPALAQSACTAPTVPTPVDGATATKDQMVAYHTAVNGYIAQSDVYQKCLQDDINTQTDAAKKNNTSFDPKPEVAMGADNQKSKQAVADKYKDVLAAYKTAQAPK
jgi:hypothetical protein